MKKIFKYNLYRAAFLLFLILLMGTLGYHYIEHFDWVDSVYMTLITVTTVGFGEVQPLDLKGKIFTIVLITFSIMVYAYSFTVISEFVVEGHFFKNLNRRRMKKKIAKLRDHVILVGLGKHGSEAFKNLKNNKRTVVVVEKDPAKLEAFEEELEYFLEGDATNDRVLLDAGIKNASVLISTLPDDADNLFIILSARQLNPGIKIVTLATSENTEKKLKLAGANHVVMPYRIGGEYLASLVTAPELINFLRMLSVENAIHDHLIEKIDVTELPEEYRNKTIADLHLRRRTGVTVIGFITPEGKYIINPPPDTELREGASIIVLGQPSQIEALNKLFHIHQE
ncbi:MAG: potassium channel protein [Chlorobi bacterium]|nr:potassium channel protein [Chlorobiota bacterium]